MRIAAFGLLLIVLSALVGFPVRVASAASSEKINKEILSRVEEGGVIRGYELEVESRGGTVWLRGRVATLDDKIAVEHIARNVQGVAEIRNELTVEPADSGASHELAKRVREKIHPLSESGEHDILISAEGSIVTLDGSAGSSSQRKRIEAAARDTQGVQSVVNNLTVSRPPDTEIAERIRAEIASVPEIQIRNLKISVHDGVAVLSGAGRTHRDIDHALALALNVRGVEDVQSEFTPKMP